NLQDFSRQGRWMQGIAAGVPFFGSQIQGLYRSAQAFKERPIQTTARALTYITVPTLVNLALNWDDEEYWDRPQWQRDYFWLVKIPGADKFPGFGGFVPIPKPFELGIVFGAIPERLAQRIWKDDPEAMDGFMELVGSQLVPPLLRPIVGASIETGANWNFFQKKNIVPKSLQDLPPEL